MKKYKMLYLILVFTFMASSISAAPLTNWAAPDVVMANDLSGEMTIFHTQGNPIRPLAPGEDMIKTYYRFDSGIHYFRMDLLNPPSEGGSGFAPAYSIQIDYIAGGLSHGDPTANDTQSYFVANPLSGIDLILTSHYFAGLYLNKVLRYTDDGTEISNMDNTNLLALLGGAFQNTENSGATLEWSLAASELNGTGALDPSLFWFVTHDIDSGDGGTYDLAIPVPESSSISLLVAGIAIFFLASLPLKRITH